jgi:hypothetical protein
LTTSMPDVDAGPGVRVVELSFNVERDRVHVKYRGPADALIAAGVVTADMLVPQKGGGEKRDEDGDHYHVQRRYNGSPVVTVSLLKPMEHARALCLPGFAVAPLLDRFRRPPAKA